MLTIDRSWSALFRSRVPKSDLMEISNGPELVRHLRKIGLLNPWAGILNLGGDSCVGTASC